MATSIALTRESCTSLAPKVGSVEHAIVPPRPLAFFRIGLSSILLAQALSMVGHLDDLFGRHGIVEWSVMSQSRPAGVPHLTWLESGLKTLQLSGTLAVTLTFGLYVVSLLGLLLGHRTRLAAAVVWLAHTALKASGNMSTYGADDFAQIGLFYCLWFPVGHSKVSNGASRQGETAHNSSAWLALKVLQLHVCIAYVASGAEKALGEQWWNGEAVWRAVMGMHDGPVDCSFLAAVPWLCQALCWMTLFLEAGCIVFIWHPRSRILWLMGIVGMHLGIAIVMNLWTFSGTMIVFDVAAFGFSRQSFRDDSAGHAQERATFAH